MDDWFQIVAAIFFIAISFMFFFWMKQTAEQKLENRAEQVLQEVETQRILLDFLSSSDEKGKKVINILSLDISVKNFALFDKVSQAYFDEYYKADTTWMIRIEGFASHEIYGENYRFAQIKRKMAAAVIPLQNNKLVTITLFIGKDIAEPIQIVEPNYPPGMI